MEKCWGTPISDRENKLRYYMIQDGCPVNGDTSLNVKSNGDSLQGRFDIKMFKFIGEDLNDVWLHCTGRYFITSLILAFNSGSTFKKNEKLKNETEKSPRL